jgi:hypothetical protein
MKNRNLYIGAGIAVLILGYVAWKKYGSQKAAATAPTTTAPIAAGNMYPPITPVIYPGGNISGATTAQTPSAWYDKGGAVPNVNPATGNPFPVFGSNPNLISPPPFGLTVGGTSSAPGPIPYIPPNGGWSIPNTPSPVGLRLA